MIDVVLLTIILCMWMLVIINAMSSVEIVSLTLSSVPFLLTTPLAIVLAITTERWLIGALAITITVWIVTGILLFVRWVTAILVE